VVIYFGLLVVICFERLAELVVSQRHASQSLGSGGIESGQRHFPVMVALHAALLAGCLIEPIALHRAFVPALGWPMFALVILANSARWLCIAALGPRWTARVIVMPGLPLVRTGPYRYFKHPNYLAVIVEGAALPLMGSAWITACTFTAANLALLSVRVRCESRALAEAQ
jgi:methyltransferase